MSLLTLSSSRDVCAGSDALSGRRDCAEGSVDREEDAAAACVGVVAELAFTAITGTQPSPLLPPSGAIDEAVAASSTSTCPTPVPALGRRLLSNEGDGWPNGEACDDDDEGVTDGAFGFGGGVVIEPLLSITLVVVAVVVVVAAAAGIILGVDSTRRVAGTPPTAPPSAAVVVVVSALARRGTAGPVLLVNGGTGTVPALTLPLIVLPMEGVPATETAAATFVVLVSPPLGVLVGSAPAVRGVPYSVRGW